MLGVMELSDEEALEDRNQVVSETRRKRVPAVKSLLGFRMSPEEV
jgi:hypothetical protein